MTRTILLCLAVCTSALSAQQQPLIGTWQISYPAGMRIENAEATRPPARLAARATPGDEAIFVSQSEATLSMNGDQRKATVVSTWRLGAVSDSLVGTVERKLEGFEMGNQEPRPVKGVRAKG